MVYRRATLIFDVSFSVREFVVSERIHLASLGSSE